MKFLTGHQAVRWVIFVLVLVFALPTLVVQAQFSSSLDITLRNFPLQPTAVQVGQTIIFEIDYACTSTTDPCGAIEILSRLPADVFEVISFTTGRPGIVGSTGINAGVLEILLETDPLAVLTCNAGDTVCFYDGEIATATIEVRVRDDAYDPVTPSFPVEIIASVTNPPGPIVSDTITGTGQVGEPVFNWTFEKERILPDATSGPQPAVDAPVQYRIQLCPGTNVNNYSLENITITDNLPPGAVFIAASGGGTPGPGPNQVTWGPIPAHSFRDGCISRTLTVRYPSPAFALGGPDIVNNAEYTATYAGGISVCTPACPADSVIHNFDPPTAAPNINKSVLFSPVGLTGTGRWLISANTNTANIATESFVLMDELQPLPPYGLPLVVTGINPPRWANQVWFDGDVRTTISTSTAADCRTNPAAIFTNVPGLVDYIGTVAPTIVNIATPNNIRCVRAVFQYDNDPDPGVENWVNGVPIGFNINSPLEIIFQVRDQNPATGPVNETVENCLDVRYTVGGAPTTSPQTCSDTLITNDDGNVSISPFKTVSPNEPGSGDLVTFTVSIVVTERASANLVNPIIADALPPSIEFIDWDVAYSPEVLPGEQLSRAAIAANAQTTLPFGNINVDTDGNGTPDEVRPVYRWDLNGLNITPPAFGEKRVSIVITGRVRPFTIGENYTNVGYYFIDDGNNLICEDNVTAGNPTGTIVDPLFGTGERICRNLFQYQVPQSTTLDGQKWLRNEDNPTAIVRAPGQAGTCQDGQAFTDGQLAAPNYSRFPCVHEGQAGDLFTYRLTIQNRGNIVLTDYILYDTLPHIGDTGVSSSQISVARQSGWRARILPNGVTFVNSDLLPNSPNTTLVAGQFTIEYSTSSNPCRPEVGVATGCDAVVWTTTPANWDEVRSFRIRLNAGQQFQPGVRVQFEVDMRIPTSAEEPALGPNLIAWNNFAHTADYIALSTGLQTTLTPGEPRKVGILIPRRGSLGNRVWFDHNNNRVIDADELGVGGVTVELYLDTNNNGVFNPGVDQLVTVTTTGNPQTTNAGATPGIGTSTGSGRGGYYLFDNLREGNYFVRIPASNFAPGQPLHEYVSSFDAGTPPVDATPNNTDHGIDDPNPALNGITSPLIRLRFGQESTTDEDDLSGNNPPDGPAFRGNHEEANIDSDLTVDFGFYKPMSLGNFVWRDNGGGILANQNNGIFDLGEAGINGVRVELYRDANSDGIPDAGEFVGFTTTSGGGYYLFQNLGEGEYIVRIPTVNFDPGQPLHHHFNSDSTATSNNDNGIDHTDTTQNNENGVDTLRPGTEGVNSRVITLTLDSEPLGEDEGPLGRGAAVLDINSDLTIDFGFYVPPLSIGNYVWFDLNNNGVVDPTEQGVGNVRVNLYQVDAGGALLTPITSPFRTTLTDATPGNEGYYIFDNLPPARYVVLIEADNFRDGRPLFEYYSSTGAYNDPTTLTPALNTRDDSRDNGIDNANPVVNGIFSQPFLLEPSISPEGETDLSTNRTDDPAIGHGVDGIGRTGEKDINSNMTIDFGFYKPMSLGNRVWFDVNSDGLISPGESGINNVRVELFRDDNNNGIFEPGEFVDFRNTNINGYYLFDNLVPGTYQVVIPASNFAGPLAGLNSTQDDVNVTGPGDRNRIDNNDNGIGTATGVDIISGPITLVLDSEPTNETDIGPQGFGANGETNRNSNLTIDFGFVGQLMALGNRVWFDPNNNGLRDPAETGIANVTVNLHLDTNNDGVPDGPPIATTTTNAQGHYLFDNLAPGTYIVALPNSNFNPGQPLVGLISSTGDYNDPVADLGGGNFVRDDNRDNGIDALHPTFGLLTDTITLVANAAPNNETDIGAQGPGAGGSNINSDLTRDFGLYRPMSLGNRVWFDPNNNGLQDPTETGIPGVTVQLYRDVNSNGIPDPAGFISDTTTDASGYYLFDGLGTGNYIVVVAPTNFQPGGPLENLNNSTPTFATNADRNDNGINNPTPADNAVVGVRSNVVTLSVNGSPTGETDLSGNPAHGPNSRGNNGETDNNSNLTIDFGFVPTTVMSLGNRVWFDEGAGPNYRNGSQDADEPGVDGVRVNLYFDVNNDGIPDGPAIATTTTTGGGYYLFDNLTPGNYLVQLAPSNFQGAGVLRGYGSTTTTADGINDNLDNGIDGSSPEVNGIFSATITLTLNNAPVGETDIGPQGIGANGSDPNSNLTVDFGLFRPLSVGNRVWLDNGPGANRNNGLQDAGEPGIANVEVELYAADGAGNPVGAPLATRTTDANGYYLFDGLPPGDYVVVIPPVNFNGTGPLVGLLNSDLIDGSLTIDRNDNGINDPDPATNGIRSNLITLALGAQPTNETDLSGNVVNDGPNSRGRNGEANNNSNLTIDFGFYSPGTLMSLGNRVWLDDGGTTGIAGNGIQDGDEVGIDGVTVQLFNDPNGDGVPDGPVRATTTTAGGGYYLFEDLPPGRYVVVIPPSNFNTPTAPLFGLSNSPGAFNNSAALGPARADQNDNGIDNPNPGANGIRSGSIQLVLGNEPLGEDVGPLPTTASDNNSNLTVDFGFLPRFDWSDAPETGAFPNGNPHNYGTTAANNGARHRIISTLFMGQRVDAEDDGQPNLTADGDDTNGTPDDEDGVVFPPLVAGAPADVEVTVFNNTGNPATLVGWIDFNGNGVFDPSEAVTITVPSSPTPQVVTLRFNVPDDADLPIRTGGTTYARFRLTTDPTIDGTTPTGPASDGEVEDYRVTIQPPGIYISKTDGANSIVVGQATTYTVTIRNSISNPSAVTGRPFQDNLDPNYINVTWTCTASALASCISGQAGGTGTNGVGNVALSLDLNPGGEIIISITATLNPAFVPPPNTISNTALFLPDQAEDINGVIFDPPFGTKIGTVLSDNLIRWTMVWLNTGAGQFATITDVLPANQTFAGNLICTAFGTSTTATCSFDIATRTVSWTGFIDTGNPNRVEIQFEVTVPGPGTYGNLASISVGPDTQTSTASVNIPGPDASPPPGPALEDPAIVKLGDPSFAQPGEEVTFTIIVTNPNNADLFNIGFVDDVPSEMIVLGATASAGTVVINGQLVSFNIAVLPANSTVTVTIQVRIRLDVPRPFIIENVVVLNDDMGEAVARIVSAQALPDTGETPLWRTLLIGGLALTVGLAVVAGVRRRPQME